MRRVRLDPQLLDDAPTVTTDSLAVISPRRIDFDDDGVRLHSRMTGPLLIPIEDIESIGLAVDRKRRLHTRVKVAEAATSTLKQETPTPSRSPSTPARAYPHLVT